MREKINRAYAGAADENDVLFLQDYYELPSCSASASDDVLSASTVADADVASLLTAL